jgi:hypothetical protein
MALGPFFVGDKRHRDGRCLHNVSRKSAGIGCLWRWLAKLPPIPPSAVLAFSFKTIAVLGDCGRLRARTVTRFVLGGAGTGAPPTADSALHSFMKLCFKSFMKQAEARSDADDEHLQIQVPRVTKRDLGQRALDAREPIRMIVLRALQAYGVNVPPEAISDRRKRS